MKAYISAKYENQAEVHKVYKLLRKKGHEIIYDWTTHDPIKPYKDHAQKAGQYAHEETEAILKCDVFIQLTIEKEGTAMFIELGIAIAQQTKTGKPKIYIVGEANTRSTYYFHPAVIRKNNIEEVLKEI